MAFVVTRADSIGGANVHVRDMARWLQHHGHEVLVLSGGRGPFEQMLSDAGVTHRSVPSLGRALRPDRDVIAAWDLAAALRAFRPEVLSLHTAKAGALGRLVAPSLGLRPLYTPHGWSFAAGVPPAQARRYRALERWLARLPGLIVDVCEHDRHLALTAGVGRIEQHVVVHNGMPERPELPQARPDGHPVRLVMVARFEEQKDHATLLHALARVRREAASQPAPQGAPACAQEGDPTWSSEWQLDLVGDGPGRNAVEALTARLGLASQVRFTGATLDVAPRLAQAQVFVLASHWEGFPRSILEAMRAGLPVVASDVGGVREAVEDSVTGVVCAHADATDLAAGIGRLLRDAHLRRRMGAAGRERYLTRFTFEHMAAATLPLYHQLVRRARPERAAAGTSAPR